MLKTRNLRRVLSRPNSLYCKNLQGQCRIIAEQRPTEAPVTTLSSPLSPSPAAQLSPNIILPPSSRPGSAPTRIYQSTPPPPATAPSPTLQSTQKQLSPTPAQVSTPRTRTAASCSTFQAPSTWPTSRVRPTMKHPRRANT